jgi:hypothetical protein
VAQSFWGVDETGSSPADTKPRGSWHIASAGLGQEPVAGKLAGIVEVDETYLGGKLRIGRQAVKPGERAKDRPAAVGELNTELGFAQNIFLVFKVSYEPSGFDANRRFQIHPAEIAGVESARLL